MGIYTMMKIVKGQPRRYIIRLCIVRNKTALRAGCPPQVVVSVCVEDVSTKVALCLGSSTVQRTLFVSLPASTDSLSSRLARGSSTLVCTLLPLSRAPALTVAKPTPGHTAALVSAEPVAGVPCSTLPRRRARARPGQPSIAVSCLRTWLPARPSGACYGTPPGPAGITRDKLG